MSLEKERYLEQNARWPSAGRHILAQYDSDTVVVYQAYKPSIGHLAAAENHFSERGGFSFERMSWIKTNFLWMMYRSGWGTKEGQEVTLAVRIRRSAFDELLAKAVHSGFIAKIHGTKENWKSLIKSSEVRLQWDPDHNPEGESQQRRAIQLGLRGEMLRLYAGDHIVSIEDISDFVEQQRGNAQNGFTELVTPKEDVYPVKDPEVAKRIHVDLAETN